MLEADIRANFGKDSWMRAAQIFRKEAYNLHTDGLCICEYCQSVRRRRALAAFVAGVAIVVVADVAEMCA